MGPIKGCIVHDKDWFWVGPPSTISKELHISQVPQHRLSLEIHERGLCRPGHMHARSSTSDRDEKWLSSMVPRPMETNPFFCTRLTCRIQTDPHRPSDMIASPTDNADKILFNRHFVPLSFVELPSSTSPLALEPAWAWNLWLDTEFILEGYCHLVYV